MSVSSRRLLGKLLSNIIGWIKLECVPKLRVWGSFVVADRNLDFIEAELRNGKIVMA